MTKLELERDPEDRSVAKDEAHGGLALTLAPAGTRGFPDRTILMPEKFSPYGMPVGSPRTWFAEFKRRKVGEVSAQQHRWRVLLHGMGYGFYTIDDDEQFDAAMERELSR